jgi:hypothetical protein
MQYSKNSLQLTTISVLRNECYSCVMGSYMLISFTKHICTVMCICITLQREIQYNLIATI